ncbi:MAG TPA: twin-arginine translocation signal domain-containing protein [Blastocatellia bacterium]|nr:twin-arginine translocation signal domain-containing protein [Blastocatellia bacterium]
MSKRTKDGVTSKTAEPSNRRNFIKTTLVGAGAVATGLAATKGTAKAAQARGFKGTVSARFGRGTEPTLPELQAAIAQIVGEYGCKPCGLLGFDIRFTRVNPPIRVRNVQIKGGEVMIEEVGG